MKSHAPRRLRAGRFVSGFSLLELMVTVSVAGTLASVAIPTFSHLLQDSRRTAVVNELVSTMLAARSRAAVSGRSIVVCGVRDANADGRPEPGCAGHDWSGGWQAAAWSDANGDGRVQDGELDPPLRLYVNEQRGVRIEAPGFANAALPSGVAVLRPLDRFSSQGSLRICDARGSAAARALVISGSGRTRVTQASANGSPIPCP